MPKIESCDNFGVVAGRGVYPVLMCREAARRGSRPRLVVAIDEGADKGLADYADAFEFVHAGKLDSLIKRFVACGVKSVVFAGQLNPKLLFKGLRPDLRVLKVLMSLKKKNAATIFEALADEFAKDGIAILPAATCLEECLAGEGVLGRIKPNSSHRGDLDFGRRIVREIASMDIGQTVVVKDGTVLAVEAFEGTDAAIRRGGELGGGGVTVVKASRRNQDMRFDLPCIGVGTVASLAHAGAVGIGIEAGKTMILEKNLVIPALDDAGIALTGFGMEDNI